MRPVERKIFVCSATKMVMQTEIEYKKCPFCNKPVEIDGRRNY